MHGVFGVPQQAFHERLRIFAAHREERAARQPPQRHREASGSPPPRPPSEAAVPNAPRSSRED